VQLSKVLVSSVALALSPDPAQAQVRVGAGVAFGTDDSLGLALQGNGYYGLDSALRGLRVGGAFSYYFADDPLTYWAIDLNAQYRFSKPGPFGVYALAGFDIGHWSVDIDVPGPDSETDLGLNFGMGIEYAIVPDVELYGELTYVLVADYDRLVVGLGGRYSF
jgi:hypothetical protein